MGALGGLLEGILAGKQLKMHMQQAMDQHQQLQQELKMRDQTMQQQSQNAAMKMIGDRMNLEMMGARPSTNGMVDEMLAAGTPEQSAPPAAASSPAGPAKSSLDQLRDSAEPPDLNPSPGPPNAPAIVAGQPAAVGNIQRKADKSRTVSVPWFGGQKMDYELPTREEQVQRQQQMAENQQLREKLGLEKANQYVLQAFGVPVPDDIGKTLGLPAGMKVLRGELPGLSEKAATVRNQGFKEVPAGGALVNTNPGAAGGAAGAPAAGGAAGGGGVVFKNPPLEDPATRAARGYTAELLGKKPEDVSYEELAKGKADWEQATMNPLERKFKEGEISQQPVSAALKKAELEQKPLDAEQKRGAIANQALDRSLKQNELDLAGDPDLMRIAGEKLLQTGQLGGMGRSKLLTGRAYAAAAQLAKDRGIDPATIPGMQTAFKGMSESLADLQKRKGQIEAFEKGGAANLDNFIALAQKQIDTGSPLINRTLRGAAKTLVGSGDQAAADAARVAAFNEISKILSGSLGNGAVSDSARKETEDLLRGDYTMPQLLRVAKVLRTDMKNRSDAYGQQITKVRQDMQDLTNPKASAAGAGQISVTAPDGSVHTFADQAAADRFKQAAGINK